MGTPTQMYDEEGEQVWERSLDLNGKVINGSNAPCPFLYQGQYYDKEIELAYNRFRYYDPDDGRYISKDPIGLHSGENNFYSYVNNPTLGIDIFGLATYSKRVQSLPKHLRRRPNWRKKTKTDLDATAINGKFYDAKTGKEITGKKVIGHQNQTWKEYQEANRNNSNLTRKDVIDDYNDINNLGYEDATQSAIDGGTFKGLEN
ncbi:RHS repeat domain-containing protein [Tenacibaculum maritimum]|uniref:RHS repeat domain-containing protein n=1 Tax=Tenacibaculum maritimum TaxID=107401 RepID=UPI0023EF1448|nr:RHS repeat-associated core domain-containing protein [Tenacibaculum maritimum]